MTSNKTWSGACATEIDLSFRFSPRLFFTLLLLYAAVASLLVLMLEPAPAVVPTALLALSLVACARLPCLGWSRHTVVLASAHDDNTWTLVERGGRIVEARLGTGMVFGCSLIFVRWHTKQAQRLEAVLFADSSDATALRRLRARLLAAADQVGEPQPTRRQSARTLLECAVR